MSLLRLFGNWVRLLSKATIPAEDHRLRSPTLYPRRGSLGECDGSTPKGDLRRTAVLRAWFARNGEAIRALLGTSEWVHCTIVASTARCAR